MIRVFIVDDHPAVRTGIWSMLRVEPGFRPSGAASDADEAVERIAVLRPDVVLVDYRLKDGNGLFLCHHLGQIDHTPRMLVYSAYSETDLALPAMLAGASGVLNKAADPDALIEAIRQVARGRRAFPFLAPDSIQAAATQLDSEELPILGMLIDGTSLPDVAATLGITREQLAARLRAMIGRLAPRSDAVAR